MSVVQTFFFVFHFLLMHYYADYALVKWSCHSCSHQGSVLLQRPWHFLREMKAKCVKTLFHSQTHYLFTSRYRRKHTLCFCGVFGEEKVDPGAEGTWCSAWILAFLPTYYSACILKVYLFHSWLTFLFAITCKDKWIMNPLGLMNWCSIFISSPLCP